MLENKLKDLKEQFKDGDETSLKEITTWEKDLNYAKLFQSLANNKAMQDILADYKRRIEAINQYLLNDEQCADRDKNFIERKIRQEFVNYFDRADKTITRIEENINKELDV
jgi:hypothetical protein